MLSKVRLIFPSKLIINNQLKSKLMEPRKANNSSIASSTVEVRISLAKIKSSIKYIKIKNLKSLILLF